MIAAALIACCFVAAYGNAMGKVVARREAAAANGRTVTIPGLVYVWTGRAMFWVGAAAASATVIWFFASR